MSTRPRITKFPVIVNGDMSAATITSSATIIQDLSMIGYSFTWTGSSPVGTIAVQVSNDFALNAQGGVANAGTWNTITIEYQGAPVQSVPVTGNTGNGFIDIDATGAYAMHVVYTKTSGTGTLNSVVNAKVA